MNDRPNIDEQPSATAMSHGGVTPPASTALPVTHNATSRHFEIRGADAPLAFLSYSLGGDQVVFEHTFVPEEYRGKGMATRLARAALNEARRRNWKVVPRCSYVAAFIERNPEFTDLMQRESEP